MKISLFLFPVIIVTALFGFLDEYLLIFLALILHEAAHLLVIKERKVEIAFWGIEPFGMKITLKEDIIKDPFDEIRIAAAGPLFSISCGILCLFAKEISLHFSLFAAPNLLIGIFNLLPLFPSDGGRILRAYLSTKTGYIRSYNAVKKITLIFSLFLILFGIYIVIKTKFNFFYCLEGAFLFYGILSEKNHTTHYLNRQLSGYKEKNSRFEKMNILRIAVNESYPVRKILKELTLKRYCIAEVFRDHRKICEFTEGELMEAMLKLGSGIKIKDIYNKRKVC